VKQRVHAKFSNAFQFFLTQKWAVYPLTWRSFLAHLAKRHIKGVFETFSAPFLLADSPSLSEDVTKDAAILISMAVPV
jgi:hypothetical protein